MITHWDHAKPSSESKSVCMAGWDHGADFIIHGFGTIDGGYCCCHLASLDKPKELSTEWDSYCLAHADRIDVAKHRCESVNYHASTS